MANPNYRKSSTNRISPTSNICMLEHIKGLDSQQNPKPMIENY